MYFIFTTASHDGMERDDLPQATDPAIFGQLSKEPDIVGATATTINATDGSIVLPAGLPNDLKRLRQAVFTTLH